MGEIRGVRRVSLPFNNFELYSILGCGCFGENEGETALFNIGDILSRSTKNFPHLRTWMSVLIYFAFVKFLTSFSFPAAGRIVEIKWTSAILNLKVVSENEL